MGGDRALSIETSASMARANYGTCWRHCRQEIKHKRMMNLRAEQRAFFAANV
jgi:hypothetical protein